MRWTQFGRRIAVGLACLGMLLPGTLAAAAPPVPAAAGAAEPPAPRTVEAALGAGGVLRGQVVDAQGNRLGAVDVSLWQGNRPIVRGASDREGRFEIRGLPDGTYAITAGTAIGLYHVWTPPAAAPAAPAAVVLVSDQPIVLGQQGPIGASIVGNSARWVTKHPLITAGVIAAAVAIPVAIHNSQVERSR